MATIDDIRIKLAVDAGQVSTGIRTVSAVMDKELRKERTAKVILSLTQKNDVDGKIDTLAQKIKDAGKVPVEVNLASFDAAGIKEKLAQDLEGLGTIPVPVTIDTDLTKKEKAATQSAIRQAVGVVTIDWQLAAKPKGGWPEPPPGWGGTPDTGGGTGPGPTGGAPTGGGPAPTAGPTTGEAEPTTTRAPRTAEQRANDQRIRKAMADAKQAEEAGDDEALAKANAEEAAARAEQTRQAKERRAVETAERRTRAQDAKQEAAAKRAQAETEAEPEPAEAEGIGGRRRGQRAAARQAVEVPTGAPEEVGTRAPGEARTIAPARRAQRLVATTDFGTIKAHHTKGFRTSDQPRGFGKEALPTFGAALEEAKTRGGGIFPGGDPEMMAELERAIDRDTSLKEFFAERRGIDIGTLAISPENRSARVREIAAVYRDKYRKKLAPLFDAIDKAPAGTRGDRRDLIEEHAPRLSRRLGTINADVTRPEEREGAISELADQDIKRFSARLRKAFEGLSTTSPDALAMVLGSARKQAENFQSQVAESLGSVVNINAGARLKDPPSRVKSGGMITGGAFEQAAKEMALPLEKRGLGQTERASTKEPEIPPGGLAAPAPPSRRNARAKAVPVEITDRLAQIRGGADVNAERMFDLSMGLGDALREPGAIAGEFSLLSDKPPPPKPKEARDPFAAYEKAVTKARAKEGAEAAAAARAGTPLDMQTRAKRLQELLAGVVKPMAEGGQIQRLSVYRGGEIGGSDFIRQPTSYEPEAAWVANDPAYAKRYALGQKRFGTGRKDRFYFSGSGQSTSEEREAAWALTDQRMRSRGMVHEGVIPASKVAPAEPFGELLSRPGLPRLLRRKGFAAVQTDEGGGSLAVFNPRYVVQRLAGPKGILPRAEGGDLDFDPKRVRHTQQWRQMSLRQRAFQPWCTYCGTAGTAKNPLEGEHIKDLALGGAPFDKRNVTTACKNCNLGKRGQVGWGPPGRAEGGPIELPGYGRAPGWRRRLNAARLHLPGLVMEEAAAQELGREHEPLEDVLADIGGEMQTVVPRMHHPDWANLFRLGQGSMDDAMRATSFPFSQNAEGGQIKHTGLLGRMVSRGTYESPLPPGFSVTQVGERGPELIVQGPSGEAEVIPTHKVPTWLARAQQGQGFGKDLTGRAEGGVLRHAAEGITGGPFQFRGITGSLSARDPLLSRGTVASGVIQRVFVVNWPAAFTGQGGTRPIPTIEKTPTGKIDQARAASGTRQSTAGTAATPPGVLPTVAAIAGAQPAPFILPSRDPAFLTRVGIERQRALGTGRTRAQAERADVAVALAESPVRAFVTAVSQVVQTLAGRGDTIRQAKAAQDIIAQTAQSELALADARRSYKINRGDLLALAGAEDQLNDNQQKRLAILRETVPAERQGISQQIDEVRRLRAESEAALKPLGGVGTSIRNLAVGGTSALVAGAGFTVAFQAMNAAFEVGTMAIAETTERTTGYHNATAELTKELALGARQAGSSAEAVIAAKLAFSGLAAETSQRVLPVIAGRAEGVAGNQALQEQLIQVAAARNIGQNRPPGLPTEFDTSLVRSTGGPFDAGLLPGILSDRSTSNILSNSLDNLVFGTEELERLYNASRPGIGIGPLGVKLGPEFEAPSPDLFNSMLDDWLQTAGERGAKGGSLATLGRETDPARIQATVQALRNIEAFDLADAIEKKAKEGFGIAFQGPEISDYIAAQFLESQRRQGRTPSLQNLLTQMTAPIGGTPGNLNLLDVQTRDIARRGAVQRETVLPAAQALAFAARPITPFMDPRLRPSETLSGEAFKDNEDTIGQYQKAFEKYADFALPAQERINAQIAKGRATLESWIGPELLGDITALGKGIQSIQLDIGQRSLNLEVSQYNNEIRIATRQLNQAKDFTKAIKGNVKDTVGGLQGQNYQLSRQLQLLGFEIQQRQINLNLALASFQTPGETSEERAARRADAEAQAKIAQEQLNLQKKISGNEFQVGLMENANAITDLTAQIALLREGKAFAIDSFAAQEAIKAMEAELQILEAEAQERFDEQVKNQEVLLGIWADFERQAGIAIDKQTAFLTNDLVPAFRKAGLAAGKSATDFVVASIMSALGYAAAVAQTISAGGQFGNKQIPNPATGATGLLFDTNGPTNLIVGEAGTETVAVLRNPRKMSMPPGGGAGGGGGTVLNVVFNNPIVRNENDLNSIIRKVEEALNRRIQLQGLR